ncbi:MAG: Gfo/Idh/MocA family oxidoreductase [Clostridia bacterium]|nr:Gfo/Idh/MocA family oxidoreductase [Clostridia bacterium]
MKKQFSVAILGCGNRGVCYTKYMLKAPDQYKILALCDPQEKQIRKMHDLFGIQDTADFLDPDVFLQQKRADVLVIASPDREHIPQAVRGMELGYDLLLEKPISDCREEIELLLTTQKRTGRKVIVCHELRYGKGYLKCEEILRSGRLGRLYAIDASERVAYWHWTQAYVKGVGASLANGHPAILAKCSHDLDLLQSYAKSKCVSVSSVGGQAFFKEENAPEGAADRCVFCQHAKTCPFSATRIYVDGWHAAGEPTFEWPYNKTTTKVPLTEEVILEGITNGPQGRCVFRCHPDLVDHQLVQMTFQNGVKASLKMIFSAIRGRKYIFYCDLGELIFDERSATIEILPFGGEAEIIDTSSFVKEGNKGHGGGDAILVQELYRALVGEKESTTTLEESVECHLMGISAEESRAMGGALVQVHR